MICGARIIAFVLIRKTFILLFYNYNPKVFIWEDFSSKFWVIARFLPFHQIHLNAFFRGS